MLHYVEGGKDDFTVTEANMKSENYILLADPRTEIKDLNNRQQDDIHTLISNYSQLFPDTHREAQEEEHHVELLDEIFLSLPIPYQPG